MTTATHELIALIDMDGTIADFDGQMRKDLARLVAPGEGETLITSPDDSQEPIWLAHRKQLIRSVPGWWENLPRHQPGFTIVEVLRLHGFTLMVLTKGPYKAAQAWTEKVNWCRKHIPDASITITEDKGLVYGKVLVDDWPAYGIRWLQWRPRGLLIVPAWHWNTLDQYPEHLHGNILRYTGVADDIDLIMRLLALQEAAR